MNIAIDVRSLMEGRHSGVEEYTTQIICAMARVAPHHTYYLFYNSFRPVVLPLFEGNIRVKPFGYPNKLFNLSQYGLGRPYWNNLVKADCFFVPNVRLLPLAADIPLVVTAHDLSFERFPEFYSYRRRLWHRFVRPRMLMRNADRVIAVSEATRADVIDLYQVPSERVSVVHSGMSNTKEALPADIGRVRNRYKLPPKYILFLGTFEPRKNIISIVRAFEAVASRLVQDLVIAGSPGWLMKPMINAINCSPVRRRIKIIGFVEEADKSALYAAADLFVYPSFYEGFGFPPLEALLAGTPALVSYNSSLPEVVGDWATLVNPYDPSEIAQVLVELLRKPQRVGVDTRKRIMERYDWDKTAHATLAVIEGAI